MLSGYQGGEGIGDVIIDAVARVKAANPDAVYACDPVMGNAKSGCFVAPAIPVLLRERVVPVADIITPNQFELGFLTGTVARHARVDAGVGGCGARDGPAHGARDQRRASGPRRRTRSRCSPSTTPAPGSCRPRGSR